MLWLKACPRCKGDLYREDDMYGSYIACLQCSRYVPVAGQDGLTRPVIGPGRVPDRLSLTLEPPPKSSSGLRRRNQVEEGNPHVERTIV